MRAALIVLVVLAVIVVGIVAWAIGVNNELVRLDQDVNGKWAQVQNQFQRRADLVPNLVETVKGYAAHEKTTLDQVVRARGAAMAATSPASRAEAENQLTGALRQLFALSESYPDLKANQNFQSLQLSLNEIEDAVQSSRRYYNAVVRDLNTAIESFPSNVIASFGRFLKRQYFELDRPEDRQVPRVSFGS